jgi:hypothetical protein
MTGSDGCSMKIVLEKDLTPEEIAEQKRYQAYLCNIEGDAEAVTTQEALRSITDKMLGIDPQLEYLQNIEYLHEDNASVFNDILNGFPQTEIQKIYRALFPLALEPLWCKGHYPHEKLELARKTLVNLNTMIRHLSPIKGIKDPFPTETKNLLLEGYEQMVALRDFLKDKLKWSRYRTDGKSEFMTKHHPLWKEIYCQVADTVKTANDNSIYSSESHISLTAKLMAAAYPWYWGKIDHVTAEKSIRQGYIRWNNTK